MLLTRLGRSQKGGKHAAAEHIPLLLACAETSTSERLRIGGDADVMKQCGLSPLLRLWPLV